VIGKEVCDLLPKIAVIFKALSREASAHTKVLPPSSSSKSKPCKQTSINFYQATWRHIPGGGTLYGHRWEPHIYSVRYISYSQQIKARGEMIYMNLFFFP
jgi:hypothetical protein